MINDDLTFQKKNYSVLNLKKKKKSLPLMIPSEIIRPNAP